MICGLLTPDSGEGRCWARLPRGREAIKRQTGYMTQKFSLYEDLTIEENLDFVGRVYGWIAAASGSTQDAGPPGPDDAQASSWPARCRAAGSSAWRWPPASCTSPSCCCSTSRPPASIPRRGASSGTRSTPVAADGLTVLVSTHYMDEAERCHEIAYIAYGELMARGTADAVIAESGLVTFIGLRAKTPKGWPDRLSRDLAKRRAC
jgi:ABC-2 type transport system ATP-binding protein